MQGHRRGDVHADAEGVFKLRWSDYEAGDYWRLIDAEGKATWYIKDPHGQLGHISLYTVEEHSDGTITVSPSILAHGPNPYHGYLQHGVWSPNVDNPSTGGDPPQPRRGYLDFKKGFPNRGD